MRKDWPWMGLAAILGIVICLFVRVLAGFAQARLGIFTATSAGGLILFLLVELGGQAKWKARASDPTDDAWQRDPSDDTSRARIYYVVGVVSLYTVGAGLAGILALDPANTCSILPKSAGGMVMARTFLAMARRRTGEQVLNP